MPDKQSARSRRVVIETRESISIETRGSRIVPYSTPETSNSIRPIGHRITEQDYHIRAPFRNRIRV